VSAFQFLLDEHVNHALHGLLNRKYPRIAARRIGQPGVPARGTQDPDILIWCEAHEYCLVTNNRALMPTHLQDHLAAGRHIPGIITLNNSFTFQQTAEALAEIWGAGDPMEYRDLIRFIS